METSLSLEGIVSTTTRRGGSSSYLNFRVKIGAGEGIRTLDPNLGKVVLYP